MRKSLPFLVAMVCVCFTLASFAQQNATINGVTFSTRGIQRTAGEVMAYEASHPLPASYQPPYREDLEGPEPRHNAAGAKAVTSFGSNVSPMLKSNNTSLTASQAVQSNFLAIWGAYATVSGRESASTPPDNNGDVGTTQIITCANTRMKVFTKPATGASLTTPTGSSTTTLTPVLNVDLNTFFKNTARGITGISDPHVRFDRLTQRWYVLAIDINHTTNNNCCIAVSSGPTITASTNFTIYYFSVTDAGGLSNDFYDYPTLGVDKHSLYIGGNMFTNQSTFSGCNMYVVNKDSLVAGKLTVTGFNHTATTAIYTPQGVNNDDPTYNEGYFIGASRSAYGVVNLRRVTYPAGGGAPTMSSDISITVFTQAAPKTVTAQGSTSPLDGGDRRPFAAMIKKNKLTNTYSLWTAQCSQMNATGVGGTGDRNGAQWYEIGTLTATPTILQSGTIFDNAATSPRFYTYPSITCSGQGHNLITFTTAGATQYAQASYAGRYRTDAAGTFQAPVNLTATTSTYNGQTGVTSQRWGDYTQAVTDPSDDMTMWSFSQYCPTTNAWGLRAAQYKAPAPAKPSLGTTVTRLAAMNVTINGTSTNNTEFYDPGADAGGPGFNRLNVTVTGPAAIAVSNIAFVSTTKVTATFNTLTAPAGTYTVKVINPDGQADSTTFTLAAPLPVTLVNFSGKGESNTVQLNWKTASEINTKSFVVEKSADGISFNNFTQTAAKGSASAAAAYTSVDRFPYPNYSYYRLRIENTDGTSSYSQVVKIKTEARNVSVTRLYPNPTVNNLNFEIVAVSSQKIALMVYDISGKKVMTKTLDIATGVNQKQVSMAKLSPGEYVVEFRDAEMNLIESNKIIKN